MTKFHNLPTLSTESLLWAMSLANLPDLPIWPNTFLFKTFSSIQTLCRAVSQFLRCLNFWIKVWKTDWPPSPPVCENLSYECGFLRMASLVSYHPLGFLISGLSRNIFPFMCIFPKSIFANNFPTISDIGNRRCLCKNFLPGVIFFPHETRQVRLLLYNDLKPSM